MNLKLIALMLIVACIATVSTGSAGSAVFYLRAGGSAQDLDLFMTQNASLEFDSHYHPDRTGIEGQNNRFFTARILPDGVSLPKQLPSGNWTVYIRNGDGNQPESKAFYVNEGITYVYLLGAAVGHHGRNPDCIEPEHNECRYKDWIPAGREYVWHEEVNHTVTVTDEEGWDEYIYHPEINHTVHHDAVTTDVYHPEVNHTEYRTITYQCYSVIDHKWFMGDGWKVRCTNHAEHGEGWHKETSRCTACGFVYGDWSTTIPPGCIPGMFTETTHIPCIYETRTVVDTPAWTETITTSPARDEIVVDAPAWVEIIHHDEKTHEEIVVDTPAYGEWIITSEGYWSEWSEWSDVYPEESEGKAVECRIVEETNRCYIKEQ